MIERRFNAARLELRAATQADSAGILTGYAALFSKAGDKVGLSEDLGGWRERVSSTAFDRALKDPKLDCKFLFNHDPNLICSRSQNGTLQLWTDANGLKCRADIANTSYGRDLVRNVNAGLVNQMSFAFAVNSNGEDWGEEDVDGERTVVRTLRSVSLYDTSAVCSPAYSDTSIHVSSIDPAVMAMGRSMDQLFPQGFPIEVRSHVPRLSEARGAQRVRNFQSLILGL